MIDSRLRTEIATWIALLRLNRRAGEAAVVGLGRAGQMVGQIVAVRVSTSLLSPSQLGGITQLSSVAGLFSLVLITPVSMYIVRGFREWHEAHMISAGLRRYIWYVVAVALIGTVSAGVAQRRFTLVSGFTAGWTALLVGVYLIASPLGSLGTTGFNLLNRRLPFALFSNVPVWLGLILSVLLFERWPTASHWLLGQFAAVTVTCLSLTLLPRPAPRTESESLKSTMSGSGTAVFAFAWPVSVQAGLWWVQSQAYRFILASVATAADVGLFSIGYGLAAVPIALYEGLFGQFYEPIFYGELKGQGRSGQAAAWNNYARAYLSGLVPVGVFVTLGGPFTARVLLGDRFQSAATVVVLAGLTEVLRGAGSMMHHLGIAKVDNKIVLPSSVIGAVLAPLGVWALAPGHPLLGTAAGLLLATIAGGGVAFYVSRKTMPISWPVREIARALMLSTPLIGGLFVARWFFSAPTIAQAVVVLTCASVYVIGVELRVITILRDVPDLRT